MSERKGRSTVALGSVSASAYVAVGGKKEGEGPLGELFDAVGEDDLFGGNTWEEAESCLQRDALHLAVQRQSAVLQLAELLRLSDHALRSQRPHPPQLNNAPTDTASSRDGVRFLRQEQVPGPAGGPARLVFGLCAVQPDYSAVVTVMSSLRMKITVTTATMLRWVTSVGLTLPSSSGV